MIQKNLISNAGKNLIIKTKYVDLNVLLKKGMAIKKLGFSSNRFNKILGSHEQGYYNDIRYDVDFFSGGLIIEDIEKRIKETDLKKVNPELYELENYFKLNAEIQTAFGPIIKTYKISKTEEVLKIKYDLKKSIDFVGSLRLGILTFDTKDWMNKRILTKNGGEKFESFELNKDTDYLKPVSSFVHTNMGLGSTSGELIIKYNNEEIIIKWDKSSCCAVPLIQNFKIGKSIFLEFYFQYQNLMIL